MKALIIVDMLNDIGLSAYVSASAAHAIVPAIRRLLDNARASDDWLVVYASDAHRADDGEIAARGRHALAGTLGAAVLDALAPIGVEREIVVTKRYYGAFDDTDLDDVLFDYEVEDVVLVGQPIDGGIRHTAYGALLAGYAIRIPTDAVASRDGVDQEAALADLVTVYGATLTTSAGLIGRPVLRTAASNPRL